VAHEIMVITPAIASLVRENKIFMVHQIVQAGKELGMHTLDQHLLELFRKRLIKYDDALAKSKFPLEFINQVKRGGG
jgi:twitching motility protein PilT